MKTTEILNREHEWIRLMAECLEALVMAAKADDAVPHLAYELIALHESFADGRHQDKEEDVLFPELLSAADQEDRDVLRKLLTDHDAERHYMSGMRLAVLGAIHGESASVHEFITRSSEYLRLHHAHMLRETEILIPMTERLLTLEADARVVHGFEGIEGGLGDPHSVEEQIRSLYRRAGLPRPPAA